MFKEKPRKDFYAQGVDMNRVTEMVKVISGHLTLEEILRLVREIAYDMVSWYSDDSKGIIYRKKYSQYHIEQATVLQGEISTVCDLFAQSVVGGREFEVSNFEKYIARYQLVRARSAEKKAEKLEAIVKAIRELLI